MIANRRLPEKSRQAKAAADGRESIPSDPELAKVARLVLRSEKVVAPDAVGVKASNGWITLSGLVDDIGRREQLGQLMGRIPGVRGVSNLILIRSHLPTIDPVRIKEAIESALERQADRDAERIEVTIDRSTVVLTGVVQSWAERCAAVGAAEHAPGVTSVTDHLHLQLPS